jgi:hypothetical protein
MINTSVIMTVSFMLGFFLLAIFFKKVIITALAIAVCGGVAFYNLVTVHNDNYMILIPCLVFGVIEIIMFAKQCSDGEVL